MNFNICLQTQFVNVGKSYSSSLFFNWGNVSFDKYGNFFGSGKLLSNTNLPIDAIQCKSIKCNNTNHLKDIDIFCDK